MILSRVHGQNKETRQRKLANLFGSMFVTNRVLPLGCSSVERPPNHRVEIYRDVTDRCKHCGRLHYHVPTFSGDRAKNDQLRMLGKSMNMIQNGGIMRVEKACNCIKKPL